MSFYKLQNQMEHALDRIRETRPLVHCITNVVTVESVANAVLAIGASPIMASAAEEVEAVAERADALLINTGTLQPEALRAMLLAGKTANEKDIPVVLDPVGAGVSQFRTEAVQQILHNVKVDVIRCNASEAQTLLGMGHQGLGVDAVEPKLHDAKQDGEWVGAYRALAQKLDAVVCVTGEVDVVTDGDKVVLLRNGTPLLRKVTGTGCMTSALIASAIACSGNALASAALGVALMGLAGEWSESECGAKGIGSFRVGLFDALSNIDVEWMFTNINLEVRDEK